MISSIRIAGKGSNELIMTDSVAVVIMKSVWAKEAWIEFDEN